MNPMAADDRSALPVGPHQSATDTHAGLHMRMPGCPSIDSRDLVDEHLDVTQFNPQLTPAGWVTLHRDPSVLADLCLRRFWGCYRSRLKDITYSVLILEGPR